MTHQTVLIGLDGATFTILDPLMQDGVMPFLKSFVASGVRSELRSVVPPLTPPAWTSLMTGRSPGQHGIFDFFCKESPDSPHIRVATAHDVHAETLWSIADKHNLRTTVLNFPLMFPPPRLNGYVIPGWMPWRQLRLGCYPETLYDRLKAIPGFNARELAMDMSLEAKAIEGCQPEEYEAWVDLHIRREQQWSRVLCTLMREDPCDLTAVLFDGPDKIQHLCWRFLDPACLRRSLSPWEQRVRQGCLNYFRELDLLLAEIVRLAGPNATVVLASDHGFGAQAGTFFINTWLEQHGYLGWANDHVPLATEAGTLGLDQLARHVYLLDWERTRAYAPTPSSNGIHIVMAGQDRKHGVDKAEYEAFRNALVRELQSAADPVTGTPIISRVWTREEVFGGPYMDFAPDLTLELHDGGLVSILAAETPFKPRPEPTGTHRPEGIFIARGPGLHQGVRLPALSILDVAPLLLCSLGLEVPRDMEGVVPAAAYMPGWLQNQPVRYGTGRPPQSAPAQTGNEAVFTKEDAMKLAQYLRKLGYIE
jgi:predicted AlkP superfamily phosphohydrolase/phosphomutase